MKAQFYFLASISHRLKILRGKAEIESFLINTVILTAEE
jgi:hypothetical protein